MLGHCPYLRKGTHEGRAVVVFFRTNIFLSLMFRTGFYALYVKLMPNRHENRNGKIEKMLTFIIYFVGCLTS